MKKSFLAVILACCMVDFTGQSAFASNAISSASAKETIVKGRIINIVHKVPMIAIKGTKGVALMRYRYDAEGLDHAYKGMYAVVTAHPSKSGLIADSILPDLATMPPGVEEISVLELLSLFRTSPADFNLIDVRPANEYAEAHIATAVSVPLTLLQEKKESALPVASNHSGNTLIFYCEDNTCPMSTQAAALAVKLGYKDAKVLVDGTDAWKRMGQLLVSSYTVIKNDDIVLIDIRKPADYEAGHIPRAVNIPFDILQKAKSRLPERRTASIVLYGTPQDEENAVRVLTNWHYGYVTLVENGLQGYVRANNALVAGVGPTEIKWERQVHSDEVAFDAFEKAIDKPSPDVILDVRTQDETKEGTLPNAVTIPLDQLESRMNELNKNKEIFVYCASGARAQMASYFLNDHGYHTKYLVGHLSIDDDGTYSFSL